MNNNNSFYLEGLETNKWATKKAEEILKASGQIGVNIDLDPILLLRQIKKPFIYDNNLKSDARLSPVPHGFKIFLNSWYKYPNRDTRWRFTIAHEIGHTLFYDVDISPPRRLKIPGLTADLEEQICNYFATYLLMPTQNILTQYGLVSTPKEKTNILVNLFKLSKIFNVSLESMCLRVINELHLWHGLIFSCRWDSKPSSFIVKSYLNVIDETTFSWRVNWRIIPNDFYGLFIPIPDKNKQTLPKLDWPEVETILNEMESNQIQSCQFKANEFGKIGNLHKFINAKYSNQDISLWIMKNDQHLVEIWPEEMNSFNNPKKYLKKAYIAICLDPKL